MKKQKKYLFTSESVSEGHPDKLCDQISDAILDRYLELDPASRVACEVFATSRKVIVGGQIAGPNIPNKEIESIVRRQIREIGYEQELFHWDKIDVEVLLEQQSKDIAMGVDGLGGKEEGAGDQGIMFGFAVNETKSLMPATIYYAHRILHSLSDARKANEIRGIGPDAKSQVTLEYVDGQPVKANTIVVSTQHGEHLSQKAVKELIRPYIINSLPDPSWMCDDDKFLVNPTGLFTIGGPESDTGLTGRKIIVDSYGGAAPHGGGAFSGKDPSKVDRSAAYALRYLAKNIVAADLATKCTLQVSYAIGVAKPLSFFINTHETSEVEESKIAKVIQEIFDLSPRGIRKKLELDKPIYLRTATYGHFGRETEADGGFSWEKLDLVDELKSRF